MGNVCGCLGEDVERFHVPTLCRCCPERFENYIKRVKGVTDVQVDSENRIVTVRGSFQTQAVIDHIREQHPDATLLEEPKPKQKVDKKHPGESSRHHHVEEDDRCGHFHHMQSSDDDEDEDDDGNAYTHSGQQ